MEDKNPIQVAGRLFQTVETLAQTGPGSLAELSQKLGLHKSTMHRVLSSLIYMDYVKQDQDTGKYSLTYKLLQVSNQAMDHVDILKVVRSKMETLSQISGETVHFVERVGTEAVYIDKVEARQNAVRMVSRVGSRIPLYCSAVGKAMLASLSAEKAREIWKRSDVRLLTEYTITDWEEFKKELEKIRNAGYALDNEENELGVRCIAASISSGSEKARYAFSISAPVNRMTDKRMRELSVYVLRTQEELEPLVKML